MKNLMTMIVCLLVACGDNTPDPNAQTMETDICKTDDCGPMPARFNGDEAKTQVWINTAEKWMECVNHYAKLAGCDAYVEAYTPKPPMADAGVDSPEAPVCWQYHQTHCVTTNGSIESVCVPYDGCGCYECQDEPGQPYCYCGPGGL